MRDKTLLKRQEALEHIRQYRAEHGFSPTLKEIAKQLYGDASNAGNVKVTIIEPLIEEGFLMTGDKKQPRTLQLTMPQPRPFYYKRETENETS